MTDDDTGIPPMTGRSPGSWRRAPGELAIVSLGVLLALWADQAMQARQEAAPNPDLLVTNVHFAGVLFPPTISKFTIAA